MSENPLRKPSSRSVHENVSPQQEGTDEFPTGIVQRIELPYYKSEEYLEDNDAVLTVMLKLKHVRRLQNRFEDPWELFEPSHTVITSSVMHDWALLNWDWEREVEVVREFQPDYHVVADRSIYQTMSVADQREALKKWAKGTIYVTRRGVGDATTLIPLAKGWKRWHFSYCARVLGHLGYRDCAFYASSYGNRKTDLKTHVTRLISEIQPDRILLFGPQSKSHLKDLPPEVVASAGTRWRKQNSVGDQILAESVEEWKPPREELLGTGQYTMGTFDGDTPAQINL